MNVGEYEQNTVQKGIVQTELDLKEGETFWTVKTDRYDYLDVKTKIEAEILSRLIRVETILNKIFKMEE